MSIRFRPYDPQRRFVCPLTWPGRAPMKSRWLSLHSRSPDWSSLFGRALDLMLLDATPLDCCVTIGNNLGAISWRGKPAWTIIDVELSGMSPKKQAVVAIALLKAARYST